MDRKHAPDAIGHLKILFMAGAMNDTYIYTFIYIIIRSISVVGFRV